jgi:hypothetical protein
MATVSFEQMAERIDCGFFVRGEGRQTDADRLERLLSTSDFQALLECEEEGDDPDEEELHRRFDDEILPFVVEQYEQDGQPDWPARREAFCNWIDSLNKDGEISDWIASNIDQPASCGD